MSIRARLHQLLNGIVLLSFLMAPLQPLTWPSRATSDQAQAAPVAGAQSLPPGDYSNTLTTRATSSCITTDELGRLLVDNSLGNGATEGCLIDYSSFPVVRVRVYNKHDFWTKIALFDTFNGVSVVPLNTWALLGYIAPKAYAEYALTFNADFDSRAMFFVNAARSEDGRLSAGWLNLISRILFVLDIELISASLGDLQYVIQAANNAPHLFLAAEALSAFDLLRFVGEIHEAFRDETEIAIIGNIAARLGKNISVSTLKSIFTILNLYFAP